mmetsp:Transcript_1831/g.3029  ORF Transcript_1831/g.3029 Transcript_1831/m.3029 type:complete len:198 (-) Transcript_1831:65-658(-)
MGFSEKLWAIILLVTHIGLFLLAFISLVTPWYGAGDCDVACVRFTLARFSSTCFIDSDKCEESSGFYSSYDNLNGLAVGGAISIIALIISCILAILGAVGNALKVAGKSFLPGIVNMIIDWSFAPQLLLFLLALFSFTFAFAAADLGDTSSTTPSAPVGLTILGAVICLIFLLFRIPVVSDKIGFKNSYLSGSGTKI